MEADDEAENLAEAIFADTASQNSMTASARAAHIAITRLAWRFGSAASADAEAESEC